MMDDWTPVDLWEQLAVGVMAVDRDGRVMAVNGAAERLLCKPRRYLLGMPLAGIWSRDSAVLELLERSCRLLTPCRLHHGLLPPGSGGTTREKLTVSLTATPLLGENGELAGSMLQMEEVGALGRLEQRQRWHEDLDSLGHLAMAVAHEVKNPLAGIRGAAQLLEMDIGSENGMALTALIRTEVDRISRLLDNLLGLAEVHPESDLEVNIHEVLDQVLHLSVTTGVVPVRDYDPSLPGVRGHRDRLVQLFLNLVKNAQEATGQEGWIRIQTRIRGVTEGVRSPRRSPGQYVMVEVRDHGSGISEALMAKIFQPFVTTKSRGTGLGLSIAQKIVHDHAGELEVESQAGLTAFRVYLPVA